MKDWREILKLERKTAQPGDPFAPPRRCNLCNYYQGRYYELHPSAEPECIQHAKALAYALAHLPLTFHPEQEFFGGAETFRADELPPEITQEMYDGALRKFQEHGVRHFGVSWSHTIPDYNGLMRHGMGAFILRAEEAFRRNPAPDAEAMLIEYNGKKKSPAQRLSINKLHARESSIFSGLEDSSVSDEDWNDESEVEEGAL